MFGSGPEYTLNFANNNNHESSKEFIEFMKQGWQTMMPFDPSGGGIMPHGISVAMEETAGYDFFTNSPIIPKGMQHLPKEEQYDQNTPLLIRWIGEKTNISPLRLNHLVSNIFSGAGQFTLNLSDNVALSTGMSDARPNTFMDINDYPLMSAFVAKAPYTGKRGRSYNEMWANLDDMFKLEKSITEYMIMDLEAEGGPEGRLKVLKQDSIPKKIQELMDSNGNRERLVWMDTEFDTGYTHAVSGKPITTTNFKQIKKTLNLFNLIGDMNNLALAEKGYFDGKPHTADFKRLYDDLSEADKKKYTKNYKIHTTNDLIQYNNRLITEMTREINKSYNEGTNFVLEEHFLIAIDILDKYLQKDIKRLQKTKLEKELMEE